MKFRVEVICVSEDGTEQQRDVAEIGRRELAMETLEFSLAEGKALLQGREQQDLGGHAALLLQMRTKVLNDDLGRMFQKWYPAFHESHDREDKKAA